MNTYLYLILNAAGILLGYIVFRVFVRRDYETKGKLSTLSSALEILIFAVLANLSYTFIPAKWPGLPSLPTNSLLLVLGFGLMAAGLIFTLWSMSGLGFKKSVGQDAEGLDRSGFYHHVRNPQICAYTLIVIGVAVLWPSLYALGWVLVFFTVAHMMIITEEEHLERLFGDAFTDYCNEVPRYLPKLKS